MLNKLQYISQGDSIKEQFFNIRTALDNGCNWIQLRYKTSNLLELFDLAESVKIISDVYMAELIINDNVHLAQQLDADGVHLGLSDMNIIEARAILGDSKIIGGTANTYEDVIHRVADKCNYIGLGPFQFTKTKQKLSPILGLHGYRSIINELKENQIEIPIYVIGGITLNDVSDIIDTGVYGIAVSGLISSSKKPSTLITQLNNKLYVSI